MGHEIYKADWKAIDWQGDALVLLDQRLLPATCDYIKCTSWQQVASAISDMVVRGAPAIAISAAYGIVLAAKAATSDSELQQAFDSMRASRPTAVNLGWAMDKMHKVWRSAQKEGNDVVAALLQEAQKIESDDLAANDKIATYGAACVDGAANVYTHCNTGALATAGIGTALGVVRYLHRDGKLQSLYAGETRPWLQGARLTSWEMQQENIPVKLVCEGAAGSLFSHGGVDWVMVGADRIAANGDVANKIGTYNLAVLARHHNMRFMVAAHTSTIDFSLMSGNDIPIEERLGSEITQIAGHNIAPAGIDGFNPVFDITPANLIDVIVTEKGVLKSPDLAGMKQFAE